jgi:hypothetical protein
MYNKWVEREGLFMSKSNTSSPKHSKTKQPQNDKLMPKRKKYYFTIAFSVMILLVLILVEVAMRVAGYGIDTRIFIKPKYKPDIYVGNINFELKYCSYPVENKIFTDMLIKNVFPVVKSKGTLRGFVIGGSSAQGFPYKSNHSFSKITELALKTSNKYRNVELLNLGISAMSSYYEKDAALKLLSFQPDFLVIYSGHNEYYGRISASTGGNYFSKNLYLHLKELKIFQLLFNLTAPPQNKNYTLMAEQFNQSKFIKNDSFDEQVAGNFIKNIEAIVKAYSRRNIPVIIVEPISNIIDMPPFSGEKDAEYANFIMQYQETIKKADKEKLREFYSKRLPQKEYDLNANIRYLDAITQSILDGKPSINNYIIAKDLDIVPFRARSELVEALRTYCTSKSGIYNNLFFVPLPDILVKQYGENILSNRIFIDQLHFNMNGQIVMSKVISSKIAEIFKFNEGEREKITSFYRDDSEIIRKIHFLPAYRIAVTTSMSYLLSNEPFTGMLLKYKYDESNNFTAANDLDRGLIDLIDKNNQRTNSSEVESVLIVDYYLNNHKYDIAQEYVNAGLWVFPGNYRPYHIAAKYYKEAGKVDQAKETLITSYLLSEKNEIIYNEMKSYFGENGLNNVIQEIDRKYGGPIKYQ